MPFAAALYRVGSGNPRDLGSFTSSERTTFRGKALAVLRPTGHGASGAVNAITLLEVPGPAPLTFKTLQGVAKPNARRLPGQKWKRRSIWVLPKHKTGEHK